MEKKTITVRKVKNSKEKMKQITILCDKFYLGISTQQKKNFRIIEIMQNIF